MNGVHDMGGMHGFGPVVDETHEPVFHAPWEGRLFALRRGAGAWRKWNIDAMRHAVERVPPAAHLSASYYARQYLGFIEILVERGLVTREEIASGQPAPGVAKLTPALTLYESVGFVHTPRPEGPPHYDRADVYMVFRPPARADGSR